MQELCPRCDAVLPMLDGAPAAFCGNCGLPQLRVAEEWPPQAGHTAGPDSPAPAPTSGVDWPAMLSLCAIASAIGTVPSVLMPGAIVSGNAGSVALFLLPVLCLATAAIYLRQRPLRRMSAGAGARMGAVLALFLTAGVTGVSAIAGFVLRYSYQSRTIEQSVNLLAQNFEMQVRAKAAGPQAESLLHTIRSPEWHAGLYLSLQLTVALFLLCVGSGFGALAGGMFGARQRRNQAAQ